MSQFEDVFQIPGSGSPPQVFNLTYTPAVGTIPAVTLNGLDMTQGVDYTIAAAVVTFTATAIGNNDLVKIVYWIGTQPGPPGSITASDFIYRAFRRCGQMRPGYLPSPELMQDGLDEWGMLFDSWAAERRMGFSIPQYVYPVSGPGSQSDGNGYDVGPSATDWVGPRPESIVRANLKFTSQGGSPVYIPLVPLSAEQWAALAIRQIPGVNITNLFYYDPKYPNGVFNVFPPLTGNAIELFTWAAFAVPANLAAVYSAPPGYMDAVVYSLAERLWPMCTKSMMANKCSLQWLAGKAHLACEKVRLVNRPIPTLASDFRGSNRPDGYYDSFVSYTGEPY